MAIGKLSDDSVFAVTPRRLEVFAVVVDAGGFGAAAAALGISQPSVSAHVRALEEQVGTDLFERHPGALPRLTPAGRLMHDYAKDAIQRAAAVATRLRTTASTMRFAAQRFAATSLLTRPLEAFSIDHPQIQLVARTGTFEEVLALFTACEVDLAFVLTGAEEVAGIETTPMARYRLGFIASPTHPLAHVENLSVAQLSAYPFISAYRSSYFGRTIDRMLQAAGFPTPLPGSQAQELSVVREMVRAGMGISVSLHRSVRKDLLEGSLVELDVNVDPMYLTLCYARRDSAMSPEIDHLIELIRQSEHQVV